jgi:hypothetical protein
MQTIETKVYEFDELDERAKEKARDWWRQGAMEDTYWSECVIDDAKRVGALMGIEIKDIYYGIDSRGDAACFTGYYSYRKGGAKAVAAEVGDSDSCKDVKRIARELQDVQRRNFYALTACVKHVGRDSHPSDTRIDVEDNRRYEPSESADDGIQELLRDFMYWIYKQLEAQYDYTMSDENVDESIRINEYTFTEDGKRFG